MKLECLDYKIERDEAVKLFQSRMRQVKLGKLLFDTGFFIPYYLFRVEVRNGDKLSSQLLAIDAVTGALDLYSFEQVPTAFVELETTQYGEPLLTEKAAFTFLEEKVRRMVYLRGFFKIRNLSITGTLIRLIYLPYWVGMYAHKDQVVLEVLDAVRGRFEGAKVRDLVQAWFAREAEN